jgi:hypothetical protein
MSKLESETFAGKTLQAWKDQAAIAGLVLRAPLDLDSGDYPDNIYSSLRHFRRTNIIIILLNYRVICATANKPQQVEGRLTELKILIN